MNPKKIARTVFLCCGGYVLLVGLLWVLFGYVVPVYAPGVLYANVFVAAYVSGAYLFIEGWE
jgi:hypothetical protein